MNVVLGCVLHQHDLSLVAAAAALCFFTVGTSWVMMLRAHAAVTSKFRWFWSIGAGTVAGSGIWATHFVAMLAYASDVPLAFDPVLTLLSAAIAVVWCACGASIAFTRLGGVAGGIVGGLAICAMHYTGMAAVRTAGIAIWSPQLVMSSVLIGVSLSGLSGWFAVRRPGVINGLGANAAFALAILGMHFTGMAAVHFLPDSSITVDGLVLHPQTMGVVVTACSGFIVALALVLALVDWHLAQRALGEETRLRVHIAELERTQASLEKTSSDLTIALEAAEAASRSKSAFLASMSHELRTPLNAVIGFSDTMRMEPFGPLGSPRYKEYLGDIHSSGEHLLSLINDILDLSRLEAGHGELHEEAFDPSEKIARVVRMVADQARRARVTLRVCVPGDLPLLSADMRRIRQIMLNLMSNALKFTPPEGEVRVAASVEPDGLVIRVQDTGIGMAPSDFAKALEPFGQIDSSLSRKYEGTGLGLPLTRKLVEMHGGSLELDSAPGHGTTVTVRLPAWRLVPRQAKPAAA